MKILFAIIAIIVVAVVVGLIVFFIRARRFKPTKDKEKQKEMLNADLEEAGFAYEPKGDYFYSRMYCWQRQTGYCRLYDEGSPLFNMIMDCEPVEFEYAGKRWLIELWKGQYGITTGGEIGIYNTSREDIQSSRFTGTFYENISDAERMPLSFVVRKGKKVVLRRKALHWWITGFKLGEFSQPGSLTMDAKIKFPNRQMCAAFTDALRRIGYQKGEFSVRGTTVAIHYDKPHTEQPPAQEGVSKAVIQQTNDNNCKLWEFATAGYPDTLDKLEFAKATMPELYHLFLKSLYSKAFFDMFDWLLELVFGHRPGPKPPKPPVPPCPPPCPPEPPCPPPCPPEPPCPPPCPPEPPCPPPCPPEPPCPPPCPPEPPCPPPCPPEPPCPPPCPPCPPCRPNPSCLPCPSGCSCPSSKDSCSSCGSCPPCSSDTCVLTPNTQPIETYSTTYRFRFLQATGNHCDCNRPGQEDTSCRW